MGDKASEDEDSDDCKVSGRSRARGEKETRGEGKAKVKAKAPGKEPVKCPLSASTSTDPTSQWTKWTCTHVRGHVGCSRFNFFLGKRYTTFFLPNQ
jgi:hypothetical protein